MIGHKLPNKTKSATIAEPKLFHQLNKPYVNHCRTENQTQVSLTFPETQTYVTEWPPSTSNHNRAAAAAEDAILLQLLLLHYSCSGDAQAFHGGGSSRGGSTPSCCNATNGNKMRVTTACTKTPASSTHPSGEISSLAAPPTLQLHHNRRFISSPIYDSPSFLCIHM
jgi:hypothetical protein